MFSIFFHIVWILTLAAALVTRAADVRFQASERLRVSLAESRAMQGFTNVNGTLYEVVTDDNIFTASKGISTASSKASPTVIPFNAPPIREVITSVKIRRPLILFDNPLAPHTTNASISIGDVSRQTMSSRPYDLATNCFSLGSVVLEGPSRPLEVHQFIDLSGVQILQAPGENFGTKAPFLRQEKSSSPDSLTLPRK